MGLSVANILLEVAGDASDGQRALGDMARDLALFAREEAEAVAYVDTTEAKVELDELKAKLAELSADEVSAEVNLKIAKAQADLTALQAELDKVDGENVTVDVDVKRGIVERIASLSKQIEGLGRDVENVGRGPIRTFISGLQDAWSEANIFGVSLNKIVFAAPLVAAVLVAVVGQLFAIVASAANAATGLGALAVAFGATLIPGVLLAVGAIAKFKAESEIAGTAAYALKGNLTDIWNAFKGATSGGANAVFQGLSDALRDLRPLVQAMRPAFTRLGEAGAAAFRLLGEQFSSPAWRQFFIFTTDSLAKLTPLFARSFGAFAAILRNIATAAMPFLVQGFKLLARGLEAIAGKTSDIGALRDSIGGMVDSLKAWGHLLGGIVHLASALVDAFAPIGDEIVAALGDGADNLADWLRSSEGLRKIQQFFRDTGPLAAEVGKLLLNVGLALVQIGQFVAPALTPVVKGFNEIIGVLNTVLSWLNDHVSPGFRAFLGTVLSLVFGLSKVGKVAAAFKGVLAILVGVAGAVGGALGEIGSKAADAFSDAIDWAADAMQKIGAFVRAPIGFVLEFASDLPSKARDIWSAVKGEITNSIRFVLQFAEDIGGRARRIWEGVKDKITGGIRFVLQFAEDLPSRARGIWGSVKGVITDAVSFVFTLPSEIVGRARGLWENVKGVVADAVSFVFILPSAIVGAAKDLWQKVKSAVSAGIDMVVHIVPDISSLPGKIASTLGFANGVEDLWKSMFALVGERGPELAFLPQGTDIYTAGETRNILKALSRGASMPAAVADAGVAPSSGGQTQNNEYNLSLNVRGGGEDDPGLTLARWNAMLRAQGAFG